MVATRFRFSETRNGDPGQRIDLLEDRLGGVFDEITQAFDSWGRWEIVNARARYSARPWDVVLADPSTAAFQVVLPKPDKANRQTWILVKNDSDSVNGITVVAIGSTIDGQTSTTITSPRGVLLLMSSGIEWKIMPSGGGAAYQVQDGTDADTLARSNVLLRMPTCTAARTVKVPANPANGTWVKLVVDNAFEFPITVDGNGKNIDDGGFNGLISTYRIANTGSVYELVYLATPGVWRVM